MQYNEGIFFGMNAVFYYSNTDQSKTVAEYIANALGWDIFNIEDGDGEGLEYEKAFIVFPVHCQNIPARVKSFLSNLLARYLIPVATYGRMHHGNVLYEIENDYGFTVIGGAFVPAKHTYIEEEEVSPADLWALEPLIEKAREEKSTSVSFLREKKDLFADLAPAWRSRVGVSLRRTKACKGCLLCETVCPCWRERGRTPSKECIRCLKCVSVCKEKALKVRVTLPLKIYLKKKKRSEIKVFV